MCFTRFFKRRKSQSSHEVLTEPIIEERKMMFNTESTNRIVSICEWEESIESNTDLFGKGDELRLKMHTYYASQMDVIMFCGIMETTALMIPLGPYSSYNSRYSMICEHIYDDMKLNDKYYQLIGYRSVICLATGIYWKTISREALAEITEDLARSAIQFQNKLTEYGY